MTVILWDLKFYERLGDRVLNAIGNRFHAIPSLGCTEPDYPSTAVVLDVPGVCQVSTYTCGITASWSIIRALGVDISLKVWFGLCHKAGCNPQYGMDIDQLARALKKIRLTVKTRRYRGKKQIMSYIVDGQPLLFGQGTAENGHWMYVYGYSPRYVFVGNYADLRFPFRTKVAWGWKKFGREINPRELYIINF